MATPLQKCTCCDKSASDSGGSLKTCSRCKVAQYCSRDCQKTDWKDHKKTCSYLANSKCACCGKSAPELQVALKKCGRCKVAQYCSQDCQKADWKKHKATCSSSAAEGNTTASALAPRLPSLASALTACMSSVSLVPVSLPFQMRLMPLRSIDPSSLDFQAMSNSILSLRLANFSSIPQIGGHTIELALRACRDIQPLSYIQFDQSAKTLTDLPNEILLAIFEFATQGTFDILSTIRSGKREGICWGNGQWAPDFRLICRKFKEVVEEVLPSKVIGKIHDATIINIYRSDAGLGDPQTYANERGFVEDVNLDVFPPWLARGLTRVVILPKRNDLVYRWDNLDVSMFPKLESIRLAAGDIGYALKFYASWLDVIPVDKLAVAERRLPFVASLFERLEVSQPAIDMMVELDAQCMALLGLFNLRPVAKLMSAYAGMMRMICVKEELASLVFHHFTESVLGLQRKTIRGLRKETVVLVDYKNQHRVDAPLWKIALIVLHDDAKKDFIWVDKDAAMQYSLDYSELPNPLTTWADGDCVHHP